MHSFLSINGISFEFEDGRVLFSGLSFSLGREVTALVGPNGIGKTCLAKLLMGELTPTEGAIRRSGAITFFPQRETAPSIPLVDYLGVDYGYGPLSERLLDRLERSALCSELSGGQWMRVRLARALGEGFLILDEPTNDLDREGREAVAEFLRKTGNGVLLISHDRECLALCESVLELSSQGLAKFGGGWTAYETAKDRERSGLQAALESAKRDRSAAAASRIEQQARQEKRNRRGAEVGARGGIPKILLGARKRKAQDTTGKVNASTMVRANEAVRKAHEAFQQVKVDPIMYAELAGQEIPAGKLVAEASGFNVRFHRWLFSRDLDFAWRGNLRLALKGGNGSGKSTLLKALLGAELETRGTLRRGTLKTLYVDQACAHLDDSRSIYENVRAVSKLDESEIRNGLAKFLFAKQAVFQNVGSLSGGERLRAALAIGLLSSDRPELLVLDEPTNNLDLANIEFLERLVRGFCGALIVISHDEVFLKNCGVTQELVLE